MKRRDLGPLPPGPRAPAAINTYRLVQHPLETLAGWRERYGDLFTVPLVVFGVGVYVCDPEAIRELFTGDQSDLHAGEANEPLSPILGPSSVLVLDGGRHLRQRKLLLPPFPGLGGAELSCRDPGGDRGGGRALARGRGLRDARSDAGAHLRGHRPGRLRRHRARPDRAAAAGAPLADLDAGAAPDAAGAAPRPRPLEPLGHVPAAACGGRRPRSTRRSPAGARRPTSRTGPTCSRSCSGPATRTARR